MDDDLRYWIGFNRVSGIGPVRLRALQDYFGELGAAWRADPESLRAAGLDARLAEAVTRLRAHVDLDAELEKVERAGVTLLVLSLAIHVIGPPIERLAGWGEDSWGTQLKIALKEGTELAGWALVVPSLLLLRRRVTASTGGPLDRRSGGHRAPGALQDEPGELVDEPRVAVKPPERRTA